MLEGAYIKEKGAGGVLTHWCHEGDLMFCRIIGGWR